MKKVAVIMGSTSDLPVASKTVDTLKSLGVPCEAHVLSAHRTPDAVAEFALKARENDFGVLIAEAGMAAHLAGAAAARTTLPVVGVPLKSAALDGLDALLSTVQMPPGMPVACVGIDAAANAALLAAQILSLSEPELAQRLDDLRRATADKILEADAGIQDLEGR